MENNKVYIGNLPYNVRISELKTSLRDSFSPYGEIEHIYLVRDSQRGKLKGFGFITFQSASAAKASLALDGTDFIGRSLRVCIAKAKEEEAGTSPSLWNKIKGIFCKKQTRSE